MRTSFGVLEAPDEEALEGGVWGGVGEAGGGTEGESEVMAEEDGGGEIGEVLALGIEVADEFESEGELLGELVAIGEGVAALDGVVFREDGDEVGGEAVFGRWRNFADEAEEAVALAMAMDAGVGMPAVVMSVILSAGIGLLAGGVEGGDGEEGAAVLSGNFISMKVTGRGLDGDLPSGGDGEVEGEVE